MAADDYRAAAILLLDEIMADPNRRKKLTVRDVQSLEVASGIAMQNGQLLAGLPTGRIEIENLRQPDHEDFNRQLARLPSVYCPSNPFGGGKIRAKRGRRRTVRDTVRDCAASADSQTRTDHRATGD